MPLGAGHALTKHKRLRSHHHALRTTLAGKKEHPFPSTAWGDRRDSWQGSQDPACTQLTHGVRFPETPHRHRVVCACAHVPACAPSLADAPPAPGQAPVGREARPRLAGMLRLPRCHNGHTAGRPPGDGT